MIIYFEFFSIFRQELVDEVMWLALINCKYLFWNTYVRAMHDTSLARPVAQVLKQEFLSIMSEI